MANVNNYPIKSGRIIGEDGKMYNMVDLLGGGHPLSDEFHDIRRLGKISSLVVGEDGKVYSLVQLLKNAGGGGGGEGGPVTWENILYKPQTYPPTPHSHSEHYTKDETDSRINNVAATLQGKVMAKPDDQPDYLQNKVDGTTIAVEGSELKVKGVDGMMSPAQINALLTGGQDNIPTQINEIMIKISALMSGIDYRGKFETYADLEDVNNKKNGDLAIVLADETENGQRTMRFWNASLGYWEFGGPLAFIDAFIALSDTPNSYENGKLLRSGINGLYFDAPKWSEIEERPSSTITQIDDAVAKRHTHANRDNLDKINEDASGVLTYNGERYVRVSDLPALQTKQRLFAYRSGSDQTLTAGTDCVFNSKHSGDIPYDPETGIFTLEAGKLYRVEVSGSLYTSGWVILQLVNAETNSIVNTIARGIWMSVNPSNTNWHESSAGPLKTYVTPVATRGYKIRATAVSGEASLRSSYMSLEIKEI